jgi:hypothetical protein
MRHSKKLTRKPTGPAVIVGTVCFLLSISVVGVSGIFLLLWIKQVNQAAGLVFLWVGPLPLVIIVMWLTVFLMDLFEKTTGTSLRTKSIRK